MLHCPFYVRKGAVQAQWLCCFILLRAIVAIPGANYTRTV